MKTNKTNYSIIMLLIVLTISTTFAQKRMPKEKMKALKTAYITNELDLSAKEAEKFWPVYNGYEKELMTLRDQSIMQPKNKQEKELSEKEAIEILEKIIETEDKMSSIKKNMYEELLKILPATKILKLHHAERKFRRKLLNEIRKKHRKPEHLEPMD